MATKPDEPGKPADVPPDHPEPKGPPVHPDGGGDGDPPPPPKH